MDIRQLHYFLVLCEEMNYTRAAQRLFLSRQALRQSISALEAELCGPLFLSAHHKLTLTDRGMSLQRHATPVVEQFQQMQAALRAEIQSAQPVHIGISVSSNLTAPLIRFTSSAHFACSFPSACSSTPWLYAITWDSLEVSTASLYMARAIRFSLSFTVACMTEEMVVSI